MRDDYLKQIEELKGRSSAMLTTNEEFNEIVVSSSINVNIYDRCIWLISISNILFKNLSFYLLQTNYFKRGMSVDLVFVYFVFYPEFFFQKKQFIILKI